MEMEGVITNKEKQTVQHKNSDEDADMEEEQPE